MAKHPGLVRRGMRWYLRARVPVDLVDFLNRDEIWRSLRTGDHLVALKLYRRARADLDTWFDAQRRRRDAGERLNGEAPRLVTRWFHETERRAAHLDFGLCGNLLHNARAETEQELHELLDGGADEDVTAAVDRVLVSAGWPARARTIGSISTRRTKVADAPDDHRAALAELVRRALAEMARRRIDRLHGRPGTPVDPLFAGSTAVQPVANGQASRADEITLAELIERFTADKGPRVRAKKMLEYGMMFRVLRELWGDHRPIREIRPQDCHQVRELLSRLPANALKRFPRLTLVQAAEHARRHSIAPMHASTANSYLGRLSTLMKFAVRQWLIERNPAEGLTVDAPEGDPREARQPFSTDQLRRIVAALPADGQRDSRFWVPIIAMFSGLRLNEVCQLGTGDVTTIDGVHVLVVQSGAGRRLKTPNARRVVPVHPALIRLGLLAYVERTRRAGHERLFPELRQDRRGYYSDDVQKWFSRLVVRSGAAAPRTSFHSLRHGFTDALRRAGATGEAIDALCGWSRGHMRERYGSAEWLVMLAGVVQRVEYPGLDLSQLYAS